MENRKDKWQKKLIIKNNKTFLKENIQIICFALKPIFY
jgi:hypothetical protein